MEWTVEGRKQEKSNSPRHQNWCIKTKVQKAYGELTWKKCTSKDPFSKMKGLKKNKVKTYGDAVYGKYRIRFYLNSKKKVVAIIFAATSQRLRKTFEEIYVENF